MSVVTLIAGLLGLLLGVATALTYECFTLGTIVMCCSLFVIVASIFHMLGFVK